MKTGNTAKKTKQTESRATFIVSNAHLKAIAKAAYTENKKKKQVLAEALTLWVESKKKGTILKTVSRGELNGTTTSATK